MKGDQAEEIKSAITATTQMVQAVKNDALNQKQLELDEFRLRNNIPLEMKTQKIRPISSVPQKMRPMSS